MTTSTSAAAPSLPDAAGLAVRWNQTRTFPREFKLTAGDDVVGTLTFKSTVGTLATGRSGDGSWSFKRTGFMHPRATVRVEGGTDDLAVFELDAWAGGGTLTLADGTRLRVTTNGSQTAIEFRRFDDQLLFGYRTEGLLQRSATLDVRPEAAAVSDLPWLLLFGWYLLVMLNDEEAATMSVAVLAATI